MPRQDHRHPQDATAVRRRGEDPTGNRARIKITGEKKEGNVASKAQAYLAPIIELQ